VHLLQRVKGNELSELLVHLAHNRLFSRMYLTVSNFPVFRHHYRILAELLGRCFFSYSKQVFYVYMSFCFGCDGWQVHAVSQQLLERLMGEWRLMEELALLRAIYLVGSGRAPFHLLM